MSVITREYLCGLPLISLRAASGSRYEAVLNPSLLRNSVNKFKTSGSSSITSISLVVPIDPTEFMFSSIEYPSTTPYHSCILSSHIFHEHSNGKNLESK